MAPCPSCSGKGYDWVMVRKPCVGWAHRGYPGPCALCQGRGYMIDSYKDDCSNCNGTGKVPDPDPKSDNKSKKK